MRKLIAAGMLSCLLLFPGGAPKASLRPSRRPPRGPGFRHADVVARPGQRLMVADLTALHAAHRREDLARRDDELPPVGRPTRRVAGLTGYHSDILCKEVYQLDVGFAHGQHRRG